MVAEMAELTFRKRHRLREREVRALGDVLRAAVGVDLLATEPAVDRATGVDMDFLLIDGRIAYFIVEERPFPTLHTLLAHPVPNAWVEVDEGAIPHLANGADCMAPGVVGADPAIREGDWVWVRDAKHKRPLAVGRAMMSGPDMVASEKGKAVRTTHWVGDKIWEHE
jgi:PUA domain protein